MFGNSGVVCVLGYLSRSKTIWATFALTIVLTLSFGVVMRIWDFGIIDEMYNAEKISAHISAMTETQRSVHAWMTATLDVAYPFAYGAFFIGVAIKAFGKHGKWLALPAILVIPADLLEGLSQVFLMNGHEDFMALKVIATPVKLVLYVTGLVITCVGAVILYLRRRKGVDPHGPDAKR